MAAGGAAVRAAVGFGSAARDWNVAVAVARADRATGQAQGSGPGCSEHWRVRADWKGELLLGAGRPAGGSVGSLGSPALVNPTAA